MLAATLPDAKTFAARERDWWNGPIVYQIFVDRFAPPANLEAKRHLYAAPRSLRPWSEDPKPGTLNQEVGLWSHELAFWGGDLKSLRSKLDYVRALGPDVVYLNPIVEALTNHKYDALDYERVAPEYGTRQDVIDLAHELHAHGMKLMLDGVFNHMGRNAPRFQSALKDPKSPYRNWFFIGSKYPIGYRAWETVANLPELRIENPEVRKYLWEGPESVVQKYLKEGVDGWRLDTAFELGTKYLHELTTAAHRAKSDSVVIGEVWNYPEGWSPAMDGIMNFHAGRIASAFATGKLEGPVAGHMLERMIADSGIEPVLRSWLVLDNHDTDRLLNLLPDEKSRHIAQALQFTLPGAPVMYYGTELGMTGAGDPGSRGPMRWDLNVNSNPELQWNRRLVEMRKKVRSLRIGDFRRLESEHLLAFLRLTDRVGETAIVLANPTDAPVHEIVGIRDGRIMNGTRLTDRLSSAQTLTFAGMVEVTLPPKSIRVFTPVTTARGGYTPYKRIE
ncbi:alpha amylase [Fimbriimonas ginsengisoli Gsoil 348]|uniref:Alpha amylase n=1 Tax=Fimbriimonas ginsengisoli Gsoil 348 TaxID=661478 RepID=A0A068NNW9_FIMGI|nr:alpha amylase [Fimbriimonas ginsengisoli Gsoil 348]